MYGDQTTGGFYGSRKEYLRTYFLLQSMEGYSILYSYPTIRDKEPVKGTYKVPTKPCSLHFVKVQNCTALINAIKRKDKDVTQYRNFDDNGKYTIVEGSTIESMNLIIPKKMEPVSKVKVTEVVDENLTPDMFEKIKKLNLGETIIAMGEEYTNIVNYSNNGMLQLYCTNCGTLFKYNPQYSYGNATCPKCKEQFCYGNEMAAKDFKAFRKKEWCEADKYTDMDLHNYPNTNKERFTFLCKHPDNDNGILIYKCHREISADKGEVKYTYSVEYSLEHIVGEKMVCYKHNKKSKRECDPFEVLNINTKTINDPGIILYDDAEDFTEFAQKNEKFLRMSGFQAALKYSPMQLEMEAFFIVFIGVLNKYPVMEQIIKMGHARMFFQLYESMLGSLNKTEINEQIEKISQLVDPEAKKGSEALRFPIYIGDYLIRKSAEMDEYYYWRDIYEITRLSKEQFENLIDSFNYAWINSQAGVEDLGNILKFGYSVEKLFNYIIKQSKITKMDVPDIINLMQDYLNMCDLCQVEADKYPSDLEKVHDDMLIYFRKKQQLDNDVKLGVIGIECERYVIPDESELDNIGIPKLFKELTVVFPKNDADFINEGNMQHNCVGSYPGRVRRGECVIFFIRKKESPNKSFITAECRKNGLGQCFYSNNRAVYDEELQKFAKYIANKIRAGVSSGQIHALGNV